MSTCPTQLHQYQYPNLVSPAKFLMKWCHL